MEIHIQATQFRQEILLYQKTGNYEKALDIAKQALLLGYDTDFFLSAASTMCIKLERWQDAVSYALQAVELEPSEINNFDVLSHAYGALFDWKNAAPYGRAALELRHAQHKVNNPILPALPAIQSDIEKKKKIISFSLFGASSAYIETVVLNVQLVNEVYPNWICRFYVDETVPEEAIQRLTSPHSEIIYVQGEEKSLPKTMWRFLAMDDESVGYIIFRDADSVISKREATTVAEWIASGCRFHTIRDSGSHTELILAGLWGSIAGSIPNVTEKMYDYVRKYGDTSRFTDQYFLREKVWGYVQQDLYASDRIFGFMNANPISEVGFDFSLTHIGCNEGGSIFRAATPKLKKGNKVVWKLHSSIVISHTFDSSPQIQDERLICQYEVIAEDGYIEGFIPKRYANGINTGLSRIELIYG
ncbi:hypothetical protein X781_14790 [Mannheimia sp. USDA-ARS-USMARC-1261]|uniref:tetratricopeptide repeat protein n=1 Tax=Mannheimia sp. USDA-ARS-USMARC-1261 TaxID=1432056 RepID=UPI0003E3BB08|nr:hypothetical protein [Mannheimia sp. USDA-ARS-USMARC-1261]AHG73626.1 hypothetical protein X781_14790 [Mannheimia sp. USDA-ARS-USMARC-1261]